MGRSVERAGTTSEAARRNGIDIFKGDSAIKRLPMNTIQGQVIGRRYLTGPHHWLEFMIYYDLWCGDENKIRSRACVCGQGAESLSRFALSMVNLHVLTTSLENVGNPHVEVHSRNSPGASDHHQSFPGW